MLFEVFLEYDPVFEVEFENGGEGEFLEFMGGRTAPVIGDFSGKHKSHPLLFDPNPSFRLSRKDAAGCSRVVCIQNVVSPLCVENTVFFTKMQAEKRPFDKRRAGERDGDGRREAGDRKENPGCRMPDHPALSRPDAGYRMKRLKKNKKINS